MPPGVQPEVLPVPRALRVLPGAEQPPPERQGHHRRTSRQRDPPGVGALLRVVGAAELAGLVESAVEEQ